MIKKIIDKFFLVKEIRSQTGELHFLRYRLFESAWFRIYIHKICKSDEDKHMHSHPWDFLSFILSGSYSQSCWEDAKTFGTTRFDQFDSVELKKRNYHQIRLNTPHVWTLVFAWGKYEPWGYLVDGGFVGHKLYRALKGEGKLPK